MSELPPKPWYKEPAPWIIMLGPFCVVIAGFWTYYIAVNTQDTIVYQDYQKQGKAVIQLADKQNLAKTLIKKANLTMAEDKQSFILNIETQKPLPQILNLSFIHPTLSTRDSNLVLVSKETNVQNPTYTGKLSKRLERADHWLLVLEDHQKTWEIQSDQALYPQKTINLIKD